MSPSISPVHRKESNFNQKYNSSTDLFRLEPAVLKTTRIKLKKLIFKEDRDLNLLSNGILSICSVKSGRTKEKLPPCKLKGLEREGQHKIRAVLKDKKIVLIFNSKEDADEWMFVIQEACKAHNDMCQNSRL